MITNNLPGPGRGITPIDTQYFRPKLGACYLLEEADQAVLIDTGPGPAAPIVLKAIDEKGVSRESVVAVIVTHIHLDHAGAAGELMAQLPNAKFLVHPRGARHMAEPEKLIAGATAVYGEAEFQRLFGEVRPIDPERIVTTEDNFSFSLGERELLFLDTPGHAKHHHCIWDEASMTAFTGDTFGISYRELDTPAGIFLFPATTPIDFDPEAAHISIDRIAALKPQWICPTHFGPIPFHRGLADDLHRLLDRIRIFSRGQMRDKKTRKAKLVAGLEKIYLSRLNRLGSSLNRQQILELLAMDIEINAQGLDAWLDKMVPGGR
ncbi:MAG: MBL fold metallo-hydrolase [Magnetococcales bacterium]|nr:MBL fold metallo-hydrolase [Magnetococcales bacterium]